MVIRYELWKHNECSHGGQHTTLEPTRLGGWVQWEAYLVLEQERDQLKQSAQMAARALLEMHDFSLCHSYDFDAGQRAKEALAALALVGVTP